MFKYLYNNEIYSALDFHEARKLRKLTLPNTIDPVSHFIVRLWRWDATDREYSVEIFDVPGHQVCHEYDDALTCFNELAVLSPEECPGIPNGS